MEPLEQDSGVQALVETMKENDRPEMASNLLELTRRVEADAQGNQTGKHLKAQPALTREKREQKNLPICGGLCDNNDGSNHYFFAQGSKRRRFFT